MTYLEMLYKMKHLHDNLPLGRSTERVVRGGRCGDCACPVYQVDLQLWLTTPRAKRNTFRSALQGWGVDAIARTAVIGKSAHTTVGSTTRRISTKSMLPTMSIVSAKNRGLVTLPPHHSRYQPEDHVTPTAIHRVANHEYGKE